jgi:anti-sigma factor RsiW
MITDFELHAFVDDQLANEERASVLEETARSAELAARLNELRNLKQLVQLAYRDAGEPGSGSGASQKADAQDATHTSVPMHVAVRS